MRPLTSLNPRKPSEPGRPGDQEGPGKERGPGSPRKSQGARRSRPPLAFSGLSGLPWAFWASFGFLAFAMVSKTFLPTKSKQQQQKLTKCTLYFAGLGGWVLSKPFQRPQGFTSFQGPQGGKNDCSPSLPQGSSKALRGLQSLQGPLNDLFKAFKGLGSPQSPSS